MKQHPHPLPIHLNLSISMCPPQKKEKKNSFTQLFPINTQRHNKRICYTKHIIHFQHGYISYVQSWWIPTSVVVCLIKWSHALTLIPISLHQISIVALVLMGLSLMPRLSGERSSGAMQEWLKGLAGFDPLHEDDAKGSCL